MNQSRNVAFANFVLPDNVQNPESPIIESLTFSKLAESIDLKVAFDYKECKRYRDAVTYARPKPVNSVTVSRGYDTENA